MDDGDLGLTPEEYRKWLAPLEITDTKAFIRAINKSKRWLLWQKIKRIFKQT